MCEFSAYYAINKATNGKTYIKNTKRIKHLAGNETRGEKIRVENHQYNCNAPRQQPFKGHGRKRWKRNKGEETAQQKQQQQQGERNRE